MTTKSKLFLLLFCLVATTSIATAFGADTSTDNERFLQANALYKNGDFAKAYDTYLQLQNKSAQVYYNIGNCAYKLGKRGYALAFWRRAEHNWGIWGREELTSNIALIKKQTTEQKKAPIALVAFVSSCKHSLISLVNATPLLYLQLLVLFLWLILLLFLRTLNKKRLKTLIFILFACLLSVTGALIIKYSLKQRTFAVIVKPQIELFSGPNRTFARLGHLRECSEIDILAESGDFYKIRFNNQIGWIEKQAVEKI